jgi:hypothetical protein
VSLVTICVQFVGNNIRALSNTEPQIFPVSTRLAARAKYALLANAAPSDTDVDIAADLAPLATDATWQQSRFGALQQYIVSTLAGRERAQLKLLSPIAVALQLLHRHQVALQRRRTALAADAEAITQIAGVLSLWLRVRVLTAACAARTAAFRGAMMRDLESHMTPIDGALLQLLGRVHRFIDEELAFSNALALLNASAVQERFEKNVVRGAAADVEKGIALLSDWLLERGAAEWTAIAEKVQVCRRRHCERR